MNLQTTNAIAKEIMESNCVNYLNSVSSDLLALVQYNMITDSEYDLLVDLANTKVKKFLKEVA